MPCAYLRYYYQSRIFSTKEFAFREQHQRADLVLQGRRTTVGDLSRPDVLDTEAPVVRRAKVVRHYSKQLCETNERNDTTTSVLSRRNQHS
ncbi:hypothetical protein O9929_05695 [Vibrio lentus]|nr:hypothetical protein [Vibrio lentus]